MSQPTEVQNPKSVSEEQPQNNKLPNSEKKTESDFSNEIRVEQDSKISSLLEHCEQILNSQKIKELLLSGSGKSLTKLVTLAEIVKSLHPNLIETTTFSTISIQVEEGQKGQKGSKDEIDNLSPKLEITLSEQEPQGLIFEQISEEKKEKLIKIWERQKQGKNNANDDKGKNGNKRRNLIVPNNNVRNGFFNRTGFVYKNGIGNNNNYMRWQGNGFNNVVRNWNWNGNRNWNGRFINTKPNWNYVNNRRFNMNYY